MKTRNWGSLKEATRRRYERNGVTREAYESGADLRSARGHAATPERPSRAPKNPERYASYLPCGGDNSDGEKPILLYTTEGLVRAYVPNAADRSVAGRYLNRLTYIVREFDVPSNIAYARVKGYRLSDDGTYGDELETFTLEGDPGRLLDTFSSPQRFVCCCFSYRCECSDAPSNEFDYQPNSVD